MVEPPRTAGPGLRFRVASLLAISAMAALALLGCGFQFPPPVAAPAPPAAHGLRVLLVRDKDMLAASADSPTAAFGDGIDNALSKAGFKTVRYERDQSEPFDLVVLYQAYNSNRPDQPQAFSFRVSLDGKVIPFEGSPSDAVMANMYPVSWAGRYAALEGKPSARSSPLPDGLDACFVQWGAYDSRGAPGTFGNEGAVLKVNAPSGDSLGYEEETELATRVGYFLVNKLTSCPGLAALAQKIQDSGVSATAGVDKLTTPQLLNLCRAQASRPFLSLQEKMVNPMDEACKIALARDPSLGPEISRVHAETKALYDQWLAHSAAHEDSYLAAKQAERQENQRREAAAREQQDQQEARLRQQHDAAMQQLAGVVQPTMAPTRASAGAGSTTQGGSGGPSNITVTPSGRSFVPSPPLPRPVPPAAPAQTGCPAGQVNWCGQGCIPAGSASSRGVCPAN